MVTAQMASRDLWTEERSSELNAYWQQSMSVDGKREFPCTFCICVL